MLATTDLLGAIVAIILFLIMTVLTFVQRAITGM